MMRHQSTIDERLGEVRRSDGGTTDRFRTTPGLSPVDLELFTPRQKALEQRRPYVSGCPFAGAGSRP